MTDPKLNPDSIPAVLERRRQERARADLLAAYPVRVVLGPEA